MMKPLMAECSTGRGNGGVHRGEPLQLSRAFIEWWCKRSQARERR